ncbi:MAG: peptidase, partial [Methanomicrobiales archaeon HGW-Methanomicrobiales-4]
SIIVGNMRGPDGDTPSLLSFDDVLGLFHEFGHILHHSLTRAHYASLSGTNTEWDFVEMPSQTFEEMAYEPSILEAISGHYLDRTKKFPENLINNIIASKDVDIGIIHTKRYIISVMDIASYTIPGPVNVTDLYNQNYTEMLGIPPISGSHEATTIDHFMGGYDAGYYSYLWSKVYALNALAVFEQKGTSDATTGNRYRQWILEPGNSKDGMDLLIGFLGKEPGLNALYSYLHLTPPGKKR